ncbi:MAG: ribonuclease D [Rhodothalassiaceae bacterium]
MSLITDQDALDALCTRLAQAEFLTVDTEFMRDSTYWPYLCLIQVADEVGAVAIDPLADLDLAPFWQLMIEAAPMKVFHACRQDLEIVYKATGALPNHLFDTQVAAMVCGYGDSVGYETLVKELAGQKLDKSARFTDWSRRPLTERQLHYALGDVTHLRVIYARLKAELAKSGREPWLDEEMAILLDPATYVQDPEQAWRRIKTRSSSPRFLGMVKALAAWREREAQARDIPKNRIAKDEVLLELAANPPQSQEQLAEVRGLGKRFGGNEIGRSLMLAIEQGQGMAEADLPRVPKERRSDKTPPVAELLKLFLKLRCQEAGVAPKMVASSADLDALALADAPDIPALHGWRYALFGEDALKLKRGQLGLTAQGKVIEIVEIEEAD